ncbi:MAG TPA: hypothetical protein VHC49_27080 [Mycobacteriales bacterium]|nr:hypothetical protein [Mycobacteriales bacterium]
MSTYEEIEAELVRRTREIVWASAATIDRQNRTRIRVLHPVWEGRIAWVFTNRHGLVSKHLAAHPYLSLSYVNGPIDEGTEQVYVDCRTEWVDDRAEKQRLWDYFKAAPHQAGYDPATNFHHVDHPKFGVLKCTPWRIEVGSLTQSGGWQQQIWHADDA